MSIIFISLSIIPLIGLCAFVSRWLLRPWQDCIFVSSAMIMLLLTSALYVGFGAEGRAILVGLGILGGLSALLTPNKLKQNTPIWLFTLVLVALALKLSGGSLNVWDDFNHWGIVAREIVQTDSLLFATSSSKYLNYPPGSAAFIYFFHWPTSHFEEDLALFAKSCFVISSWAYALKESRDNSLLHQVVFLTIFLLTAFSVVHGFRSLMVDDLMVSCSIIALIIILKSEIKIWDTFILGLCMLSLAVIKSTGILLVFFFFFLLWVNHPRVEKAGLALGCLFMSIALTHSIAYSNHVISQVDFISHSSISPIKLPVASLIEMVNYETVVSTIKRGLSVYDSELGLSKVGLAFYFILAAIVLLSRHDKFKTTCALSLTYLCLYIIFLILLGVNYDLNMSHEEAAVLHSFDRYAGSVLIPLSLSILITIHAKGTQVRFTKALLVLGIISIADLKGLGFITTDVENKDRQLNLTQYNLIADTLQFSPSIIGADFGCDSGQQFTMFKYDQLPLKVIELKSCTLDPTSQEALYRNWLDAHTDSIIFSAELRIDQVDGKKIIKSPTDNRFGVIEQY